MLPVPDSLKLNRLVQVGVPTLSQYMAKFGLRTIRGQYSGEETAVTGQSKLDSIIAGERAAERAAADAAIAEEADKQLSEESSESEDMPDEITYEEVDEDTGEVVKKTRKRA